MAIEIMAIIPKNVKECSSNMYTINGPSKPAIPNAPWIVCNHVPKFCPLKHSITAKLTETSKKEHPTEDKKTMNDL